MSDSFWEAINNNTFTTTPPVVEYRVHYDEQTNTPLFLATDAEEHTEPYIVITHEQHQTFSIKNVIIKDGIASQYVRKGYQQDFVHPYKDKTFSWIHPGEIDD